MNQQPNSSLEDDIQKIKTMIERQNKNNSTGRRSFSKSIKKKVILLCELHRLPSHQAAKLLDLQPTSLRRWIGDNQEPQFKKVVIKKNVTRKKRKSIIEPIHWVLLMLQALLIIERISLR
jgi:hypothetical protein